MRRVVEPSVIGRQSRATRVARGFAAESAPPPLVLTASAGRVGGGRGTARLNLPSARTVAGGLPSSG